MIENTSNRDALGALLLGAMLGESPDELIGGQEKRGQAQLVNSDRLPTEICHGDRDAFEALGFTFGELDARDPLFTAVELPAGWTRQGSDHAMWSYILDDLGRRRVRVFYKAAFYDRRSHMSLVPLVGYLRDHVHEGQPLVTDPVWATPQALAVEARLAIAEAEKNISRWNDEQTWAFSSDAGYAASRAAKYKAERDQYAAILASLDTGGQQP